MDRTDAAKLKSALIDAFMLDAEEAIASCPPPITVSEAHEKRMREIISSKPRRRISNRKVGKCVIAILVAVLFIFLTSCAMFYQKIVDFIVTTFDKYSRVEQSVSAEAFPQTIEEVRVPMVMLEGYEITEESLNSFVIRRKWTNEKGDRIVISQTIVNNMYYAIDTEDGNYTKLIIGNNTIFKHYYNQWISYVWIDDYQYNIMSSTELSEDELEKVIESIK